MKNNYVMKIFIIVSLGLLMPQLAISATATWVQMASPFTGSTITSFSINPNQPNTMYVGTRATIVGVIPSVNKSTDGGVTWKGILGQPIDYIVIDPVTPNILYVGAGNTIFKSINGGATWSIIMTAGPLGLGQLAFQANVLYIKGFGLSKSLDGGATWISLLGGSTSFFVRSIAIDPANPSTMLLATSFGIVKSTDGGLTSAPSNTGLPNTSFISSIKYDPFNSNLVFAIDKNKGKAYKSIDGGATWGAWNNSFGLLYNLYFDPLMPKVMYATSYFNTVIINGTVMGNDFSIYKSTDGGTTWIRSPGVIGRGGGEFPVNDLIISGSNMYLAFSQGVFRESSIFSELQISIKNNPGPISTGAPVSYIIKAINKGPDNATSVVVTDTLPANTVLTAATSTKGTCTSSAGVVTCSIGSLVAGSSATINLSLTASTAGNISNTVAITAVQPDPFTTNNSANTSTQITSPPPSPTPAPAPASGGGGCIINTQSEFDPTLPLLALIACAWLVRRRRIGY